MRIILQSLLLVLVIGSNNWNWIQDQFKGVAEKSEELFTDVMEGFRGLSTGSRIVNSFGGQEPELTILSPVESGNDSSGEGQVYFSDGGYTDVGLDSSSVQNTERCVY